MKNLLMLCFICSVQVVFGQNPDSLAQLLVQKHIAINSAKMSMPGFRVQIFSSGQRIPANETRSNFMRKYEGIPAYMLYHQPNFKIRIGDCRTRLEALKLLSQVQKDYPNAFVVKDEVKLPEIRP
jgi:hypothetical protein